MKTNTQVAGTNLAYREAAEVSDAHYNY